MKTNNTYSHCSEHDTPHRYCDGCPFCNMLQISIEQKFHFGGGGTPAPPKPAAPPTKDQAALNVKNQGNKRTPFGASDTIIGDNNTKPTTVKTLLGQ